MGIFFTKARIFYRVDLLGLLLMILPFQPVWAQFGRTTGGSADAPRTHTQTSGSTQPQQSQTAPSTPSQYTGRQGTSLPAGQPTNPPSFAAGIPGDIQKDTPEYRAASLLDEKYVKCGQDCIYQKANEVITQQVDQMLSKRDYINGPGEEEDKRKVLGNFCGVTPVKSKKNGSLSTSNSSSQNSDGEPDDNSPQIQVEENIDDCIKRFNQVTAFWLLKTRGALGQNHESIAKLTCRKWENGACTERVEAPAVDLLEFDQQREKKEHHTYFTKAKDLAALREQLKYAPIKNNRDWQENFVNELKPDIRDFVQFKTIDRNPENPGAGHLEVPIRKENGEYEYNIPAYKRALKAWEQLNVVAATTANGRRMADVQKRENQEFINDFKKEGPSTEKSLNRQLFDMQHGQMVQQFQNFRDWANQANKKSVQYPGTKKTTPTTEPTGSPGVSGASGVTGPSGRRRPQVETQTLTYEAPPLKEPENGYTGNEEVAIPPQKANGERLSVTRSISGADIGVFAGTGAKEKAKARDPRDPTAPPKPNAQGTTNTRDGTDTQSLIDLYF